MNEYGLVVFRSRQAVLRFADALEKRGIHSEIVSAPHILAQGCGLAAKLESRDLKPALQIYRGGSFMNLTGFYRVTEEQGHLHFQPILTQIR